MNRFISFTSTNLHSISEKGREVSILTGLQSDIHLASMVSFRIRSIEYRVSFLPYFGYHKLGCSEIVYVKL